MKNIKEKRENKMARFRHISTKMVLVLDAGAVDGKKIRKRVTIGNIREDASPDALWELAEALGKLLEHPVAKVLLYKEEELVREAGDGDTGFALWASARESFPRNPRRSNRTASVTQSASTSPKAIHAQEDKKAALEKAGAVSAKLREMKLREAADKLDQGIGETLTYMDFPSQYWSKIRTNNVIERLNLEIRRRTRVAETLPDGRSALMLVCARARYVTNSHWGTTPYMPMKHLNDTTAGEAAYIAG